MTSKLQGMFSEGVPKAGTLCLWFLGGKEEGHQAI